LDHLSVAADRRAGSAEFLANFGAEAAGGSPADLKAFTQAEIEKWGPIIKAANINF
jgi:tripartite-type tricarboxylate transporter receptor subunit TctC